MAKCRTKQTTELLYKRTEAEAKAKKVHAEVEKNIYAAKEEVKGSFGVGKEQTARTDGASASHSSNNKDGSKSSFSEEKQQGQQGQSKSRDNAETLFSKVKFGAASISPKVSKAFRILNEAKPIEFVKKGYAIVRDELNGNHSRRKHLEYDAPSAPSQKIEKSTRMDIVVVPSKQSPWSKKWEAFKNKMRGSPVFKRASGFSEPVIEKSQEIAEDMRENGRLVIIQLFTKSKSKM